MSRCKGLKGPYEVTAKPSKSWRAPSWSAKSPSGGEPQERSQERQGLGLLSMPELVQELGMGKSWVYRRLRSREIPSLKLGRSI
jgi:hypothetical protein